MSKASAMILCRAVSILVLVLVGVAYLFGLGGAPGYLGGDEAHFAVGGDAIAATGPSSRACSASSRST